MIAYIEFHSKLRAPRLKSENTARAGAGIETAQRLRQFVPDDRTKLVALTGWGHARHTVHTCGAPRDPPFKAPDWLLKEADSSPATVVRRRFTKPTAFELPISVDRRGSGCDLQVNRPESAQLRTCSATNYLPESRRFPMRLAALLPRPIASRNIRRARIGRHGLGGRRRS